jgi:hypothetical protein
MAIFALYLASLQHKFVNDIPNTKYHSTYHEKALDSCPVRF